MSFPTNKQPTDQQRQYHQHNTWLEEKETRSGKQQTYKDITKKTTTTQKFFLPFLFLGRIIIFCPVFLPCYA